jgi:hypothetical protein
VVAVISGYSIIKDANNFRENFYNGTNLFLLKDNTSVFVSGIELNAATKTFKVLPAPKVADIQEHYKNNDMTDIKKPYYKIIIVDIDTIDKTTDQIFKGVYITANESKKILLSNNAKQEALSLLAQKAPANGALSSAIERSTSEEVKAMIFENHIATIFDPKDFYTLVKYLKSNQVEVIETTALFKALKTIPTIVMKDIIKNPEILENTTR